MLNNPMAFSNAERFLGIVPSAPERQLELQPGTFIRFALSCFGIFVFSPAPPSRCSYPKVPQRLSESIHD